ncbi:kinase-like domain-containing protein [Syncephalis plumigaleata]|nr:kinase-like domain-containing protein [Syncephalis plumigaleata]
MHPYTMFCVVQLIICMIGVVVVQATSIESIQSNLFRVPSIESHKSSRFPPSSVESHKSNRLQPPPSIGSRKSSHHRSTSTQMKKSFLDTLRKSQRSTLARSGKLSDSWVAVRRSNGKKMTASELAEYKEYLEVFEDEGITFVDWIGNSGPILAAKAVYNGQPCFVKCSQNKRRFNAEFEAFRLMAEKRDKLNPLQRLGERWVVRRLHDFLLDCCTLCHVLSHAGDITLHDYMYPRLLEDRIEKMRTFTKQLVYAIAYLHAVGIAHGDIKTENILVNDQDKENPYITVIDFDLSASLKYVNGVMRPDMPIGSTFGYYAPEELLNSPINMKARDAWQTGSAIYDALRSTPPYGYTYNGMEHVELPDQLYMDQLVKVWNDKRHYYENISDDPEMISKITNVLNVMKGLMIIDPKDRKTPQEMIYYFILTDNV